MFSAPAQMTLGQAPAGQPAASQTASAPLPSPASGSSATKINLPLILGLVGILVVALLIVAFFAFRPH
jgi:hypothetical protein